MPRGKVLNDQEKGMIIGYHDSGLSMREIARRTGRSLCVVQNFLTDRDKYGKNKRKPRKSKFSDRVKRQIIKSASNSTKSLAQLRAECKLDVSREAIRQVLKANPNIVRSKKMSTPSLKPIHKENRLQFARKNMARDWNSVNILTKFTQLII